MAGRRAAVDRFDDTLACFVPLSSPLHDGYVVVIFDFALLPPYWPKSKVAPLPYVLSGARRSVYGRDVCTRGDEFILLGDR